MKLFNVYSQNGEDAVLEYMLGHLNVTSGTLVEFGAWDGFYFSNIQYTFQQNKDFHVVFIEPDKQRFEQLVIKNTHPNIHCLNEFITTEPNQLTKLLEGHVHGELQVMSMDTDNNDLDIWRANSLRPKIVIIECPKCYKHSRRFDLYSQFEKDGYKLVYVTGNYVFVRKDCLTQLCLPDKEPEELFQECRHVDLLMLRGIISGHDFDTFIAQHCVVPGPTYKSWWGD